MKTRGQKMLWISLIVMFFAFLLAGVLAGNRPILNEPVQIAPTACLIVCLISVLTYIIGFAWMVDEKGYPGVMKLLIFTGFIGLIVILAVPKRDAKVA